MDLIDIVKLLDNNSLVRSVVSSPHHNKILSFSNDSQFSIKINDTTYNETNKVCLASTDNTLNFYVNNLTLTNYTKIDITTISSITIL